MALKPAARLALATMLLGSSAIGAEAGWFDFAQSKTDAVKEAVKENKPAAGAPGTSLEESIAQARALRLSGNYPEAIKHLSQVMMVASDDAGVVSEYGKSLAAMGRAQDAVNFLMRATQLQPGDWSVFSALGVAYDQLGNQKEAQAAYEQALALKPGEPSVLSNYALSRMLANDPAMARKLAGRAEIANANAKDARIAANIALIRSTAPEAPDAGLAVNSPAPMPMASAEPQAAPRTPVAFNPMPMARSTPMASDAPRPLNVQADSGMIQAASHIAPQVAPQVAQSGGVVMQRVPVDPLAGPVQGAAKAGPVMGPAISAAKAPRTPASAKKTVAKVEDKKGDALDTSTARSESPKPVNATAPGVKSAASHAAQAENLQARADAVAKEITDKPAAIAAVKAEASKEPLRAEANGAPRPLPSPAKVADVKPADTKPAVPHVLPEKTVAAAAPVKAAPVKAAEAKPEAPHMALPAPVKTTDAKPAPAPHVLPEKPATAPAPKIQPATPTKTATAKPKDTVPALRVSSSAY